MTNSFSDITRRIAAEFAIARTQPMAGHSLARAIEYEWPAAGRNLTAEKYQGMLTFASSAGIGAWNASPWLAILHPDVTTSAQAGFYPVYLFEPGFQTICLVLGQGAKKLEDAVGSRRALVELSKRADILRRASSAWESCGFSAGPFQTTRNNKHASKVGGKADPWATSVAFGKRYHISSLPPETLMRDDLNQMLKIYATLVKNKALEDSKLDDMLLDMALSGEMSEDEAGVDGAKRVAVHKQYEYRHRNKALISRVKKRLGTTCQACDFRFGPMYGASMNNYIEAHHSIPISTLADSGAKLKPTEEHFMVLCSNCHRAIHAAGCPDLATFKSMLR
jgi:5-methylcytosine-specific restriction protein A